MRTLFIIPIAVAGFASAAMAQTITVNPIADAFVSSANPTNNYGGAGALAVSATGSAEGIFDSVIEFNLSSAAGLSIQSITLQLAVTPPNNGIFNSSAAGQFSLIWMPNTSWTEGTGTPNAPTSIGITYNTLPSFLGPSDETVGTFSLSAATSGTNDYTLQLTPGFLNAVTSGSDVSFEIVPADNSVSALFDSRSFTSVPARPVLTVVAVPEPGAALLSGAGALVLVGCRRRWPRKA